MPHSPLAASASRRSLKRLEMDQVRTTLSKQDPGQHRRRLPTIRGDRAGQPHGAENLRSTEKPANSEPHFACWAVNARSCRSAVHLSVVRLFGSHQFARSQQWICPRGGRRRAQLPVYAPGSCSALKSVRASSASAPPVTAQAKPVRSEPSRAISESRDGTTENRAGVDKPDIEAAIRRERESDLVRIWLMLPEPRLS
jgi:hypothetical protein